MQLGQLENGRWNGQWMPRVNAYTTATLASLRATSRYHVVSDAQLKRDMKGRTLADIYRENRAKRGVEVRYVPRWQSGEMCGGGLAPGGTTWQGPAAAYVAWCKARNHTPHPASIDSEHPMHAGQREKCPKRETISAAEHNAATLRSLAN